jgi:hypothetical protein
MSDQEPRVVIIHWIDAAFQSAEVTLEELQTKVELISAGLLVCEDDDTISIALDRYDFDDTWRRVEHIPRGMITRRIDMVPDKQS